MMPSRDEQHQEKHDAIRRLFVAPARAVAAESLPVTMAQAEAAAARAWTRDRADRIRAGACPVCAERLCPRVGGRDLECVPSTAERAA